MFCNLIFYGSYTLTKKRGIVNPETDVVTTYRADDEEAGQSRSISADMIIAGPKGFKAIQKN